MLDFIRKTVSDTLEGMGAKLTGKFDVMTAPEFTLCDYATNAAVKMAVKNKKKAADDLAGALEKTGLFEEVKVLMPFVNMKLSMKSLVEHVNGEASVQSLPAVKEKILIEFVSANPTGPLHVGHLRGAVMGDALARILRFSGYEVITHYYVNDRGRQVQMLAESILATKAGEPSPEGGYSGDWVNKIADEISSGDDADKIKQIAVARILAGIKVTLDRLGIFFDVFYGEKKLYDDGIVEKTLEKLKEKKAVFEKDGAVWLDVSDRDDKDRVLYKKDGEPTYFLSDIAYHDEKFSEAEVCINIWGADHHGYVERLKSAVALLGRNSEKLEIILYQLVRLKRGAELLKMSKRDGTFLLADDVIDEVGADAVRYFLLSRKGDAQLDFDLELAKEQSQKNPVYYLQYAHARICSIFEKAAGMGIKAASCGDLIGEESRGIIKKICEFTDKVELASSERAPHHITSYLSELCALFHGYYDRSRVLDDAEPALSSQRLFLTGRVRETIRKGLELLGISAPERM
ncbi:arginine--tRNA ligase [bacterium]|nr:arginine--tRNA ligase [bacterium]MBU4134130.1 arginine--tRNA ligase [bacterium]